MKLGFATHPRRDLLEEIEWIGRSGFGFVDLFLEPDRNVPERLDPEQVRAALDRQGLDAVGHLPWYLPIGSPLPQLRTAAADIAREYLRVLAQIGVPAATIHSHWPPGLFQPEEGVRWQVESLRALLGIAGRMGLQLMYEPVGVPRDLPDNTAAVLDALPDLLLHLDLGHANLYELNPVQWIRRFAGRLHHLHLHDNHGDSDRHLPPGAGTINWEAVIKALKETGYDRTITLEVFSQDRDYVLVAKRKIETLWARL
jgi:sugar phosphate isomerase/epimerase